MKSFVVRGSNRPFPIDMLRYDCCYPARSEDVAIIQCPLSQRDKECLVRLVTTQKGPTIERWASFGWVVEGQSATYPNTRLKNPDHDFDSCSDDQEKEKCQTGWVLQEIGNGGFAVDDPIEGSIFTIVLRYADVFETKEEAESAGKRRGYVLVTPVEVRLDPKKLLPVAMSFVK